jgi:hypothetical protein
MYERGRAIKNEINQDNGEFHIKNEKFSWNILKYKNNELIATPNARRTTEKNQNFIKKFHLYFESKNISAIAIINEKIIEGSIAQKLISSFISGDCIPKGSAFFS